MHHIMISLLLFAVTFVTINAKVDRDNLSTADHSKFIQLRPKKMNSKNVLETCTECHNNAHEHIAKTIHWNGGCTRKNTGEEKMIITGNQAHIESTDCMSCHTGFSKNNPGGKKRADCLSCHDNSGYYNIHERINNPNKLKKIVKSIGTPTRSSCGKCHFNDFPNSKYPQYGDLTKALNNPTKDIDIHMDKDGNNFNCQNCHFTINHKMAGRRTQKVTKKFVVRGSEDEMGEIASCEACHTLAPHKNKTYMNHHVKYISCQTCHIPHMAKGNIETPVHYNWQKQTIETDTNLRPSYHWSNGDIKFKKLSDKINLDSNEIYLNRPEGKFGAGQNKIYPFKEFTALRAVDMYTKKILIPSELPQNRNYSESEWKEQFKKGMKLIGENYSGNHKWVNTKAFYPVGHMVAPKNKALKCADCHSDQSLLTNIPELYIPGRDKGIWDYMGWGLIILNLLGVSAHATGRVFSGTIRSIFTRRKKNEDESTDL